MIYCQVNICISITQVNLDLTDVNVRVDTLFRITFTRSLASLLSSKAIANISSWSNNQISQTIATATAALSSPSYTLYAATESEPMFVFDADYMSSLLVIGGSQLSLRNTANKKWSTARINSPMESGLHRWEVQIDRCVSKNIFIGVCTADAKFDNYCGCDKNGWAFLANKAVWHNKTKIKTYGELFKTGDIITVTLDLDAETLSFSLNGLDLGIAVAFDPPASGPLYPAFSLYNEDDQISILPPRQIGDELSWRTSTVERMLNRQEVLYQLFEFLMPNDSTTRNVTTLAQSMVSHEMCLQELSLRWELWTTSKGKNICNLRSYLVGGECITISSNLSACHAISMGKLQAEDQVVIESRTGRVLGVSRNKLWIKFDGLPTSDIIVGYTQDNIVQLLAKGLLRVLKRDGSIFSNKESSKEDKSLSRKLDDDDLSHDVSRSNFTVDLLEESLTKLTTTWTKDKDIALVQVSQSMFVYHIV
jgi:hypothetical protein